jgi:hypothetical protein
VSSSGSAQPASLRAPATRQMSKYAGRQFF